MGDLIVSNTHQEAHTIQVDVESDGTSLSNETVELAGDEYEVIESTWSAEPKTYEVSYAVSGPEVDSETQTETLTREDAVDGDCTIPAIELHRGAASLQLWAADDSAGECPE
ncbi:hypothetical protein [Natrononativus amylolyticus]|uniref:hypothetical protein n=1 Tax=Natrononativus amylolyticus TaxID=2963434 RepID=UPI0020CC1905|nr:hypothetical protein [Natrononativus amylolyticus]